MARDRQVGTQLSAQKVAQLAPAVVRKITPTLYDWLPLDPRPGVEEEELELRWSVRTVICKRRQWLGCEWPLNLGAPREPGGCRHLSFVIGENGIYLLHWILVRPCGTCMKGFFLPVLSSFILRSHPESPYPASHLAEPSSCTRVPRPAYPLGAGNVGERLGQVFVAYELPRSHGRQAVEEKTEHRAPTFQQTPPQVMHGPVGIFNY